MLYSLGVQQSYGQSFQLEQFINAAVLNSSPRTSPPLCIFRMLLLSLQMFVLLERKCPAKWTSGYSAMIPVRSEHIYSIQSALKCARRELKLYIFTEVYDVTLVRA